MAEDLTPGFADPVAGAQHVFRAVLDAMARPGRRHSVAPLHAPAPLCDAAASVLLTLVDPETPLWLDPAASNARPWIAFHTGAPLVPSLGSAMFALALRMPDLTALPTGTDEAPEASGTVILQVSSLRQGRCFWLEGPGLREPAIFTAAGLPDDFAQAWQRNHALFPRGVDLILCAGNELAALPRGVNLKEA